MECAVGRTSNKIEKVSNGRSCSLSRKSIEQKNLRTSSKDREVSALFWMNSDRRLIFLTFIALESDARWRFLVPFLLPQDRVRSNCTNSEANITVGGVGLTSSPPAVSLIAEPQPTQLTHEPVRTCSTKSFQTNSNFESNVSGQSRYRALVNRRTKAGKGSGTSQQSTFISTDSSPLICDGSSATSSADQIKDVATVDNKPVKRSSKKKGKKKKKQGKNSSSNTKSISLETSEEGTHGSSVSETSADNDSIRINPHVSENEMGENIVRSFELAEEITICESNDVFKNTSDNPSSATTIQSYCDGVVIASETTAALVPDNCTGEIHLLSSAKDIETRDSFLSTSNEGTSDIVLCDANSGRKFNSFSDDRNSDDRANAGDDAEQSSRKEDNTVNPSEPSVHANDSTLRTYAEKAKYRSPGCSSSSTIHPVQAAKTGKQVRRQSSGNSSGLSKSSSSNVSGRVGKENSLSIWQKVQKDECLRESNAAVVVSKCNSTRKESPLSKRVSNSVDSDIKKDSDRNSKVKVSKNLTRKPSTAKHEYCRKGAHANKTNSARATKMKLPEKEIAEISGQVDHQKSFSSDMKPLCYVDSAKAETVQTNVVECSRLEQAPNLQACSGEHGSVCITASGKKGKSAPKQSCPSSRTSESLDPANILGERLRCDLHPATSGSAKLEAGVSHTENGKQDQNSVCLSQKWVPVVKKDVGDEMVTSTSKSSLLSSCLSEAVEDGFTLEDVDRDKLDSDTHASVSMTEVAEASDFLKIDDANCLPPSDGSRAVDSNTDGSAPVTADAEASDVLGIDDVNCLPHSDGSKVVNSETHGCAPMTEAAKETDVFNVDDVNCLPPSDDSKVAKLHSNVGTPEETSSKKSVPSSLIITHEPKEQNISVVEIDSDKITRAVSDAFRIEMAATSLELATGSPLAEFERLVNSASPVLDHINHFHQCQSCPRDHLIGPSLCRHEIPDVSLGNLWQWYEKHGSYGLEVRGEDCRNSKRIGNDQFSFRAYFVPLLSAVQLFGKSRTDAKKASGMCSDVSHVPFVSALLHQPQSNSATSESRDPLYLSESSSISGEDELLSHDLPVDDSELLFEYFESEQPQQRKPLFEKIKELIRGDGLSKYKGYGDPKKLESVDLYDLNPASWYSVAWYPIYRIPDGKFRASFLTYHSLGHLIHRGTSSDCPGSGCSIASPVVGLQSYNAQGECWFQLKPSAEIRAKETSSMKRHELLKERLRTLENTASVMARAVVSKEKVKSMNRQPDYEFFLSRRR